MSPFLQLLPAASSQPITKYNAFQLLFCTVCTATCSPVTCISCTNITRPSTFRSLVTCDAGNFLVNFWLSRSFRLRVRGMTDRQTDRRNATRTGRKRVVTLDTAKHSDVHADRNDGSKERHKETISLPLTRRKIFLSIFLHKNNVTHL